MAQNAQDPRRDPIEAAGPEVAGIEEPLNLDPDALYNQGLAYYRSRRWREAKLCFERLNQLQPSRRGVEGLLRELDIFLQLESVEAEAAAVPPELPPEAEEEEPPAAAAEGPRPAGRRWGLIVLGFILAALAVVLVFAWRRGWLPLGGTQNVQALRNVANAYAVAQQWCKALDAYQRLLAQVPGDPEAEAGVKKSKDKLCAEALTQIKAGNRAKALENLECLSKYDANYACDGKNVVVLRNELLQEQELDKLYQQARSYLNSGVCSDDDVVKVLLKLRATRPDYKPGTISDDLYEAYICQANRWLDLVAAALQPVPTASPAGPRYNVTTDLLGNINRAIKAYDNALKERPTSDAALQAKSLAESLATALERYSNKAWLESLTALLAIYRVEPTYLGGKLVGLLCDVRLHLGDAYLQNKDYRAALEEYQAMLGLAGCDVPLAQTRAHEAGLPLTPTATPTPTLTFTPTLTPTNTPRPTATNTPAPTYTPLPTFTPTAPPPPQPTKPPPPPTATEAPPPRR